MIKEMQFQTQKKNLYRVAVTGEKSNKLQLVQFRQDEGVKARNIR